MDTIQMLQKLQGLQRGAQLFVSYEAGRPSGEVGIAQAKRARIQGIKARHYTGALVNVQMTRRGDITITLFVNERDSGDGQPGNYRVFNPSLGNLVSLEVLSNG